MDAEWENLAPMVYLCKKIYVLVDLPFCKHKFFLCNARSNIEKREVQVIDQISVEESGIFIENSM